MNKLKTWLFLFVFYSVNSINAQVFWTEAFQNGCSANCPATGYAGINGTWTVTDNSPALDACGYATSPNTWYVSGAECGNAAGGCGTACSASDPSLHVGSTTAGDIGAAFDSGGWCSLGLGGWGSGTQTDKRCESPGINCTGKSSITLAFNYIENGEGANDNATLNYFNGIGWAQLTDLAKTSLCGIQGRWTAFSTLLPVSANNNANIKIGYRWVNNDDGTGNDPSFAVDDITLSAVVGLPIELLNFNAAYNGNVVDINWSTASEINNHFYTVEKTKDGYTFEVVGIIDGAGNSNNIIRYDTLDEHPYKGTSYYRLSQTDFDGTTKYFDMVAVQVESDFGDLTVYPNPVQDNGYLTFNAVSSFGLVDVVIYDVTGRKVVAKKYESIKGKNKFELPLRNLQCGLYLLTIYNEEKIATIKFTVTPQ